MILLYKIPLYLLEFEDKGLSIGFSRHGWYGSIAESEQITDLPSAKEFAAFWRGRIFGLKGGIEAPLYGNAPDIFGFAERVQAFSLDLRMKTMVSTGRYHALRPA